MIGTEFRGSQSASRFALLVASALLAAALPPFEGVASARESRIAAQAVEYPSSFEAALQTTFTPNTYTANICGAICPPYAPTTSSLQGLKNRILAFGGVPAHIGIQEACSGQVLDFVVWLRTYVNPNYQVAMWPQLLDASGYCGPNSSFGVASYVIASPGTPQDIGPFATQATGDGETRGSSCILGVVFTFYAGCTAHMNNNPYWAELQFRDYVDYEINSRAYGSNPHAVWWGGDLYVVPTSIQHAYPGFSYLLHYEADRCVSTNGNANWTNRNKYASSDQLNKFDYVFRSGPGRSCGGDATLWPSSPSSMYRVPNPGGTYSSDHRIESGSWA